MQPISQTVQMSLEAASEAMVIVSNVIGKPEKYSVYQEHIDHGRLFCDLVENATRLHTAITRSMMLRGGLADDPVPTITIHSDMALSVAYLVETYNAAS